MDTLVSQIGGAFLKRYFTTLKENPAKLRTLYKDESVFTHVEDDVAETFHGGQNIATRIQTLANNEIEAITLSSAVCQNSLNEGIIVLVSGSITMKNKPPRRFMQTFFLAVQTHPQGYFVLNDVLHYLDSKSEGRDVHHKPEVAALPQHKEVKIESSPAPIMKEEAVTETKEAPKNESSPSPASSASSAPPAKEEKVISAPSAASSSAPKSSHKSEPKHAAPKPSKEPRAHHSKTKSAEKSAAAAESPKSEEVPAKKEVKVAAEPSKPSPPPASEETKVAVKRSWLQIAHPGAEAPPAEEPKAEGKESKESHKKERAPRAEKRDSKPDGGVYLSNLPFDATDEQIRATFATFGKIVNIQLKSPKGFGFIEFESFEIATKIIEESKTTPFTVSGRPLSLQYRRAKNANPPFRRENRPDKKENLSNGEESFQEQKEKKPRDFAARKEKFDNPPSKYGGSPQNKPKLSKPVQQPSKGK